MYEDKDSNSIHQDMLNDIDTSLDTKVGSFVYDLTKPAANQISEAYVALDQVVAKLSIENLSGDELAARINERTGLTRKPAGKATTTVTVTGNNGAQIKIGDKVASDTVNFIFTEAKTITSGSVSVLVECEQAGTIGNVPIGAIKYFPVTLAGLSSVTNPSAVTNGFDEESDADLLKRYYAHIQTPVTSNNAAYYKNLINQITGVGDNRIVPLWAGDNTFKVIIIDSNKQPASPSLVSSVQDYLDPNMDGLGGGAVALSMYCTVVSATALNIDVSFTITKDSGYTLEQVTTNVHNAITDYLKSIAFITSQVSYAKVGNAILDADGVLDYTSLTVNGGTSNVAIASDEVAVLGTLTIT